MSYLPQWLWRWLYRRVERRYLRGATTAEHKAWSLVEPWQRPAIIGFRRVWWICIHGRVVTITCAEAIAHIPSMQKFYRSGPNRG